MTTIDVRGLTKRYGPDTVVDDVSFTVEPGQVTGFLGPNGAGKSRTREPGAFALRLTAAGAAVREGLESSLIVSGMRSEDIGALAAFHGVALSELTPQRASLEDAFMELTRDSVQYQGVAA